MLVITYNNWIHYELKTKLPSIVNSIGKDPKRNLEVASSSNVWDENNIIYYSFGPGDYGFWPKSSWYSKKKT